MTVFDRFDPFERRITEAIDEIAATRPPAYLNDILRQTARVSQRPGWTFPERWLPVDTTLSRPGFARPFPVRQLLILALVGLLAVAAAAYIAGASRRDPAFGPAGNGLLAYTSANDLYVADQRGAPRLLAAGVGFGPQWSRDGSQIATVRPILIRNHQIGELTNGPNYCSLAPTCVDEIVITDLQGKSVVAATLAHESWVIDWSADGRQMLVEDLDRTVARTNLVLVSVDGTPPVTIGSMLGGFNARFTSSPSAPILYLAVDGAGEVVLSSTDRNGFALKQLATAPFPREGTSVAFDINPDGSEIALLTDTTLAFLRPDGEQVRVLPVPGSTWIRYSSDGKWLLLGGSSLLRASGSTLEAVATDRELSGCEWAPDAKLVVCQDATTGVWLVDLATRTSTPTTLSAAGWQWAPGVSWQRVPGR